MTSVLTYLERSAARLPQKTAVSDPERSYSYAELLRRSKSIGSGLIALGVERRSPIPIMAEKSADMLAAMLGAVYAGCFYVPIDPRHPAERIERILGQLDARLLFCDAKSAPAAAKLNFSGQLIDMGGFGGQPDHSALDELRAGALDTDPLYAIFTSGSTGTPKGVAVCHRSVVDFIEVFTPLFGLGERDVIGNQAPFDFDVSTKDIYSALRTGATIEILPRSYFSFPTKLMDRLCERGVTTLIWAVSALSMVSIMNGLEYRLPEKIDKILFSGEVMPVKHLNHWRQHLPDAMYVNLYGPTEITCNCTYHIIDREYIPGDNIPMGIPFPNERVFLLNDEGAEITEPGVAGEVCVCGTALALGYIGDPERTAAAFCQNPLERRWPERMYRTGDLAKYGPDRLLYYISRRDFQIKHMGQRIELGEIEAAVNAAEGVELCCCIYEQDKIVLFYSGLCERKALLAAARLKLPPFMLPNVVQRLDALPLNKNGKLDRAALAALYRGGRGKSGD